MLRVSALSLQYIMIKVSATKDGLAVDPTGNTVQMAFPLAGAAPVAGDWKSASWETDATTSPDTYYARCLVGPSGTVALTAGTYDVWVKVTDNPEIPVMKCGLLEVF